MQVCDQCNTEIKVVYICPKCGGRFCREHKKPENHNCIKVNTPANIIEETQTYEEPYENTSTDITEETNTYEDSYENTPINIIDETQTHEEIYENNSIDIIEETQTPEDIYKPSLKSFDKEVINSKKNKSLLNTILIKQSKDNNNEKIPIKSLFILAIILLSIFTNSYLFLKYMDYKILNKNYVGLYNSTKEVNLYYDNLTAQYSELRREYDQLRNMYTSLVERNSNLEEEYMEILNYEKEVRLVDKKTIIIQPKGNYSEIWDIPFSGYVEVNYNASGELYTWIGSNQIENCYYSRNPQFPKTSATQNFTIPVLPDFMIYFANPDEYQTIEITYTIIFTY